MTRVILYFICLLSGNSQVQKLPIFETVYPKDTYETRAVWLNNYAFDSPVKRIETLQKITDANLNTVFSHRSG